MMPAMISLRVFVAATGEFAGGARIEISERAAWTKKMSGLRRRLTREI
jgi:hypothetical protein